MGELKQCEFFLLRYVPDLVKDEFVNIGVVVSDTATNRSEVRFAADWSRVRCLDPDADIEMLEAVHSEIGRLLREGGAWREQMLGRMRDSFSNSIQLSGSKACLTESPEAEIENLAELYLKSAPRVHAGRSLSAREQIRARMQDEFEKADVWKPMHHRIAVTDYTGTGDPLKIDCGYVPRQNGTVKLFHALSLSTDVDSAKVLAFTYPQLAAGIARKEKKKTELTAVVNVTEDGGNLPVRFALRTLEDSSIRVARLAELPMIAERARRELGM